MMTDIGILKVAGENRLLATSTSSAIPTGRDVSRLRMLDNDSLSMLLLLVLYTLQGTFIVSTYLYDTQK